MTAAKNGSVTTCVATLTICWMVTASTESLPAAAPSAAPMKLPTSPRNNVISQATRSVPKHFHHCPRTNRNERAIAFVPPIRSRSITGNATDHATASQIPGTTSRVNAIASAIHMRMPSQIVEPTRRRAKRSELFQLGSRPRYVSAIARKHATGTSRKRTKNSTRNATTAPMAAASDAPVPVADTVIRIVRIANAPPTTSTIAASVLKLRRTRLIDTSRISPSASGRSCGAAAGSALIPRGSLPTGEATPCGGRRRSGGGRRPVRRAAGGRARGGVAGRPLGAGALHVLDRDAMSSGARVAGADELGRRLVRHELGLERAPHAVDLLLHLLAHLAAAALERLEAPRRALELLLEREHALDAGEVQPELVRHLLDAPQAVDVGLRVQARAPRRALGLDQAARLVHPQRLRMHGGELGRHRDHEDAAVAVDRHASRPASSHHEPPRACANSFARGLPFMTCESLSTASDCSVLRLAGTSMTKR